jgi:hypothetical protein
VVCGVSTVHFSTVRARWSAGLEAGLGLVGLGV